MSTEVYDFKTPSKLFALKIEVFTVVLTFTELWTTLIELAVYISPIWILPLTSHAQNLFCA